SIRPAPTRWGPTTVPSAVTSWTAVFISAFFTSVAFHPGRVSRTSAVMPAACGEAIDVPDITVAADPPPISAEAIVSPGAARSGLTAGARTPREVNELGV